MTRAEDSVDTPRSRTAGAAPAAPDRFLDAAGEDPEWIEYGRRFAEVYDESNYAGGLQGYVMRSGHRFMERGLGPEIRFERVLEVGAGTGAHLSFVRHAFGEYHVTDLDAKALEVAKSRNVSVRTGGRTVFDRQSASQLGYANESFDRLVATHVLEHLYYPHAVLREWRRVVKPGGIISVLLPTDPGFAWRMGRRLGPRRRTGKLGFDYDYVMAREHVNPLNNLLAFLRHYFPQRTEGWWPCRIPSMDLNLFYVCHATVERQ